MCTALNAHFIGLCCERLDSVREEAMDQEPPGLVRREALPLTHGDTRRRLPLFLTLMYGPGQGEHMAVCGWMKNLTKCVMAKD